jgi:hypothetical protein
LETKRRAKKKKDRRFQSESKSTGNDTNQNDREDDHKMAKFRLKWKTKRRV